MKRATGNIDGFENMVDLKNGVVHSIAEGKTTVVFASDKVEAPQTALDKFIQNLRNGGQFGIADLIQFRRIKRPCGQRRC